MKWQTTAWLITIAIICLLVGMALMDVRYQKQAREEQKVSEAYNKGVSDGANQLVGYMVNKACNVIELGQYRFINVDCFNTNGG